MRDLLWGSGRGSAACWSRAAVVLLLCGLVAGAAAAATLAVRLGAGSAARPRCSRSPTAAARFIVPPAPFTARVVSVRRLRLPPGEPAGGGPTLKRLYLVTFHVLRRNAVLPAGHTYSQFAYVTRKSLAARWCFLKGGSGP